jgi:hypothetical protein
MTSDEPAEQVINLAFADADVKQRMRENGVSNSAGLGTGAWIGQKAVLILVYFRLYTPSKRCRVCSSG